MTADLVGIDVGSTNVKVCLLAAGGACRQRVVAHEGDVRSALRRACDELSLGALDPPRLGLATGTEGRRRVRLPQVIAPVAVEAALDSLGLRPAAVVSAGGEDLVVYALDRQGQIVSTHAGNKCASGTGEFFRQQLGRMDLTLPDLPRVCAGAQTLRLSARCSVFMKSDCTHRLNKGEATKGDIALSLSRVMADKITEFLIKAKIRQGQVVLVGGVTQNRFLVQFLEQAWPGVDFIVPEQAPYFEAYGAARLAASQGGAWPRGELVDPEESSTFDRFEGFHQATDAVRYPESVRGAFDPQAEYVLGVDGGSTTTKVALVNRATLEIVASHYGRTHGDPVAAVKDCLRHVRDALGGAEPNIVMVATTGSSRELLGVFLESTAVYNEIIAHTVGTTYFEPDVDTLFEIGGQDAKYVHVHHGVPIDYAMNEACSAGTGSFLEESAAGDLNISRAEEIGPIALRSSAPLKFGEHCSAFINSDIRKAIQQGASRPDVVGGLVFSIVANYLNRVVGNRAIGSQIVLQGGVAKNPAVPLAFARMTGKPVTVAPDPELMGCFGVARLALQKHDEGLLALGSWSLADIIAKEITYRKSFVCKSCDNFCEVRRIAVSGRRYPFGGRCSRFTNLRRDRRRSRDDGVDYTAVRTRMMFEEHAPDPRSLRPRTQAVVGIPLTLSVHSLWPLYSWYFHELGVRTVRSERVSPEGIYTQESNYCFPVEIAHGAIHDVLQRHVDWVFLPHFRDMPSMEAGDVHACVCPLTQGLPFFARHAFDLSEEQVLRPLVTFKHGWDDSRVAFERVAEQLGFRAEDGARAYRRAVEAYRGFLRAYERLGRDVLREVEAHPDQVFVVLLGRPYNAFTGDANMGIPRKLVSRGVSVIPFDMIFEPTAVIPPNNYWYFGQQNMKAVARVREISNLYLTWISNFSCAPDSFLLHYVRWAMGQKPYLVLEIDSHTADAGLDTRIEAFLDIVQSYRLHVEEREEPPFERRYQVVAKEEFCDVLDRRTGERVDIRNERVTLVWPSMGDLSTEALKVASERQGIQSVHLPLPNRRSTQLARNVASGKECIPALLVLGSILQFFDQHPPNRDDELWVVFVPSTLGPCRTGQYHVFYERVFEELGWENVVQLIGGSENSYREMGPTFTRDVWRAIVLGDLFTDLRFGIRLLARDPDAGLAELSSQWQRVMDGMRAGPESLDRAVRAAGRALGALPRRRSLDEIKKVLIVGEIYVRRDNFSVQEISDFLIEQGVFPKLASVSEWFHYTDYARQLVMAERRRRDGLWRSLRDGGLQDHASFYVEAVWKGVVERKLERPLMATGLIPEAPADMGRIIEQSRCTFVEPDLESEATVSPAVARAAMEEGYSGIAIIAPFGCLPGRLIEGVYAPWAKRRGYPVIALENDGQPYPPNVISRMEIFAHNVLRYVPQQPAGNAPGWAATWSGLRSTLRKRAGFDEP